MCLVKLSVQADSNFLEMEQRNTLSEGVSDLEGFVCGACNFITLDCRNWRSTTQTAPHEDDMIC